MIQTRSHVEQFLLLTAKEPPELRAICEGLQLKTEGTKEELIRRLIGEDSTPQTSATLPQAISLCSKDPLNGKPMESAIEAFRRWRKTIFHGKGNIKDFQLLDSRGKQYKQRLRYLDCAPWQAIEIIENRWFYQHPSQADLLILIAMKPERFSFAIIRKETGNGNTFLMLHCQPRTA